MQYESEDYNATDAPDDDDTDDKAIATTTNQPSEMDPNRPNRGKKKVPVNHPLVVLLLQSLGVIVLFEKIHLHNVKKKETETSKQSWSIGLPCKIRFKDPSVSICNYLPYDGLNFGDELGPAVVDQILQRFFSQSQSCHVVTSKHHLTLKDSDRTQGRRCFFAGECLSLHTGA